MAKLAATICGKFRKAGAEALTQVWQLRQERQIFNESKLRQERDAHEITESVQIVLFPRFHRSEIELIDILAGEEEGLSQQDVVALDVQVAQASGFEFRRAGFQLAFGQSH